MRENYTNTGPGRLEGLSAFEAFLVENVDTVADETSGDVEAPTGWFARCGRYVVSTDSQGFWYADRYTTRALAAAAFTRADAQFSAWFDQDDIGAAWFDDNDNDTGPSAGSWAAELAAAESFYADPDLFGDDGTC